MTGGDQYYLDTPTEAESTSHTGGDLYFIAVIRDRHRHGWVFRFSDLDMRLARETLAALNWPCRPVAA